MVDKELHLQLDFSRVFCCYFVQYIFFQFFFFFCITFTDFEGDHKQKYCETRLFPWTIFVLHYREKIEQVKEKKPVLVGFPAQREIRKNICECFSKWNSSSEACLSPGPNYPFMLQLITLILHRWGRLLLPWRNLNRMIFQFWFYLQTVVCQFEEKPEYETETPVFSSCYNWNLSRHDSNVWRCSLQGFGPFPPSFHCWCIKH